MALYKIFYNSKKVSNNFLYINAKNPSEALNKFPEVYEENGGNISNVKKVLNVLRVFKVSFTGRKIGAIGIFYKIKTEVIAPNEATNEEIRLKLYENFEHISEFKILKK